MIQAARDERLDIINTLHEAKIMRATLKVFLGELNQKIVTLEKYYRLGEAIEAHRRKIIIKGES